MPVSSDDHSVSTDLLARVPLAIRNVLEIGCGTGEFGRAYKLRNPLARYVGVEIREAAAGKAREVLDHVIVGNIEDPLTIGRIDACRHGESFDALVVTGALGYLLNPGATLRELRSRVATAGVCTLSIPNLSSWRLMAQQFRGRWDYLEGDLSSSGHVRFFTRDTAIEMLREAGWEVLDAAPGRRWPQETDADAVLKLPIGGKLGADPEKIQRDASAFEWNIRATNGPCPPRLHVAALGLKKQAGVTEARVDHPLAALSTNPFVRAVWDHGQLSIPKGWDKGVLVLHRQFMTDPGFYRSVSGLADKGWILVSDMDDDPGNWPQFQANDYLAFRGVHAVTVSTPALAQAVRQLNPNVQVFENAIFSLPHASAFTPKQGNKVRIFFGALNRREDWARVQTSIVKAALQRKSAIHFVVVHDEAVFASIPPELSKEFHPTVPHERYMQLLATCDLAMLPLNDTPFNRFKSDLKFIECCAAGVVPICSSLVYAEKQVHREIGVFATTPEEWATSLLWLLSDVSEIAARREKGLRYVEQDRMHSQHIHSRMGYYEHLMANRDVLELGRKARIGLKNV